MEALGIRSSSPASRKDEAKPARRRLLRALATVLMLVGVLALVDAGVTLLWQEPLTAVYGHLQQGRLEHGLAKVERSSATPIRRAVAHQPSPGRRLDLGAHVLARQTRPGDPLGRLRIARIGLSAVVVQGTAGADLQKGPGHYPKTPLPGEGGTIGIAGHRTTFGAWFRHVDRLKPGDPIELTMPYGQFTYRVQATRIVPSDAWWITRSVGYSRLVLSACHPLYSATKRIVVFARLTAARPRGPAA
jgi:sortase A